MGGGLHKVFDEKPAQGGSIAKGLAAGVKAGSQDSQIAQLQKQVGHLTKLVHILWKEAEQLEKYVQLTKDGLRIKAGVSEILVLNNGGIILNGQRIHLKTPGQDKLMF